MPLSSTPPDDSLIWNSTANGIFSVRSAYKVAMDLTVRQDTSGGSSDGDIKKFGEEYGDYKFLGKVKNFARHACKKYFTNSL